MDDITLDSNGNILLPQPDQVNKKEKDDAMGAYLMMFATLAIGLPLPLINLVAALIYHLFNNRKSRFAAFHSLQSLTSQIPITLLNAGATIWTIRNIVVLFKYENNQFIIPMYLYYLLFVLICNCIYTIYSIIACYNAAKGRFYYIPFFGRYCFSHYYNPNTVKTTANLKRNQPPR